MLNVLRALAYSARGYLVCNLLVILLMGLFGVRKIAVDRVTALTLEIHGGRTGHVTEKSQLKGESVRPKLDAD
jgi:hypothetical protein